MRILTIMILVLSFNSFAQLNNDWITPFATVEFKENKIFYYHAEDYMISQHAPMFKPEYLMIINILSNLIIEFNIFILRCFIYIPFKLSFNIQ